MAEKRRFLDVWIVDTDTVYQEVPYDVVADWLQQGRLLESDKVKPSGTKDWVRIGDSPEMRPYSLAPQPDAPVDSHEPADVDHDSGHRRHAEAEDDDIDMIPLIDVTLVLLIFFMMTATTVGAAAFVPTPKADHGERVEDTTGLRIDINDDNGTPLYNVAEGNTPAEEQDRDILSLQTLLDRLRTHLDRKTAQVTLTINAHRDLKAKTARDLLLGLRRDEFRNKISFNFFGVSEMDQ